VLDSSIWNSLTDLSVLISYRVLTWSSEMGNRLKHLGCWGGLAGCMSWAIALPSLAGVHPEAACYAQALTFGANRSDHDRSAYLCEGATTSAPAQCYWNALSFGATDRTKRRIAYLCRGATSTAPAQCYWDSLSFGATRSIARQALQFCRETP
jgi:hypothetical protein